VFCTAFVSLAAAAFDKPAFPRLGGYKIGNPKAYETEALQADLAKLDLVVIGAGPGWEAARRANLEDVIRAIKKRNPQIVIVNYVNVNDRVASAGGAWKEAIDTVEREKWWLYPQGTSGAPVASTWAGNYITNYTLAGQTNSKGEKYVDWFAKWIHQQIFSDAPSLDGAFTDNFFWKPRVVGDWDRDGVPDPKDSPKTLTLHQQGMRHHIENLRRLMPGKYQLGNVGDWGSRNATYPEYKGLLNGGVLEHYIGDSWSPEGQDWKGAIDSAGSWNELMRRYRVVMRDLAEPKLLIFNQFGDPHDYQSFRYGLTSCLMDNGYYDFSDATDGGYGYGSVPWFDEYGADLGNATSEPPTVAWKSGVFRRDFESGIALVNPRGNGSVTVDLEKDFIHISGTQDRAVNNGQTTRRVTLKDRDGIILLDPNAKNLPRPPRNFRAE
jgi:hypothetical protein